jgi:hypothetical protein
LQLIVPTGKNANFNIFALILVCLTRSGFSSKEHSEKKQTKINNILKQQIPMAFVYYPFHFQNFYLG